MPASSHSNAVFYRSAFQALYAMPLPLQQYQANSPFRSGTDSPAVRLIESDQAPHPPLHIKFLFPSPHGICAQKSYKDQHLRHTRKGGLFQHLAHGPYESAPLDTCATTCRFRQSAARLLFHY
ncbi:hypothetical protein D3C84_873870 [compost metagenome]